MEKHSSLTPREPRIHKTIWKMSFRQNDGAFMYLGRWIGRGYDQIAYFDGCYIVDDEQHKHDVMLFSANDHNEAMEQGQQHYKDYLGDASKPLTTSFQCPSKAEIEEVLKDRFRQRDERIHAAGEMTPEEKYVLAMKEHRKRWGDIASPNQETAEAMEDARRGKLTHAGTADNLMKELNKKNS